MIIETCPRCGADLKKYIISTSPPTEAIKCDGCGWYREGAYVFEERDGWSGRERAVRVPYDPEQKSVRVYMDDQYIARDAAREKLCSVCEWEGTSNCEECENPIDDIPPAVLVSREKLANSRDSHEITNADRIRSMSDEELAKILSKTLTCPWVSCKNMEIPCEECLREWPKSPAESSVFESMKRGLQQAINGETRSETLTKDGDKSG